MQNGSAWLNTTLKKNKDSIVVHLRVNITNIEAPIKP